MLPEEDAIRLRHMVEAGQAAQRFMAGRAREDLDSDEMLSFAVVRALEIVGEAASQVGEVGRAAVPSIPWPQVVGMRNRLAHAYFGVSFDRVWDVLDLDLPPMMAAIEQVLAQEQAP